MLALTATTDAIEIVLGEAHSVRAMECYATWRDITTALSTPGRSVLDTTGTTALDLVTGPGASTSRIIDTMSVFNNDTVQHVTTLKFDENNTEYKLVTVTLLPGELLVYADGAGWLTYNATGALKEQKTAGYPAITDGWTRIVLSADVTDSSGINTYTDITGLSFAVTSGQRYVFKFLLRYTAAATTTGAAFSVNGPAITSIVYRSRIPNGAGVSNSYIEGSNAYNLPAAAVANSVVAGNIAVVEGLILPSASGTLIGRVATEVDTSAIVVKAGSLLQWRAV